MSKLTKEEKSQLTEKFGASTSDTGNTKVQIALLTERIKSLTEHVKSNKKDFHSTRGLIKLVSKRKSLLKYYSNKDLEGYRALIKELGLRK